MNKSGFGRFYRCQLQAALLLFLQFLAPAAQAQLPGDTPQSGPAKQEESLNQADVLSLLVQSQTAFARAQDILRFASVKLPSLITDNQKFRAADKSVESCREEIYPAENAAKNLKAEPRRLKELMRLYMGIRFLQLRCLVLGDQLGQEPNAAALSSQVLELSNKFGQLSIKFLPYVKKVVDAYDLSVPDSKLESILPWEGSNSGFK